jgi:hypothetical protein
MLLKVYFFVRRDDFEPPSNRSLTVAALLTAALSYAVHSSISSRILSASQCSRLPISAA